MLIILLAATAGIITLGLLLFLVQGAPFVPSDDRSTEDIIRLVRSQPARRILDMGSGDGKLVLALAKQGYQVDGIELNPLLVLRSRRSIKRAHLQDKAAVKWGNFWRQDIRQYDTVTLYAIKHIMPRLEKKLRAELQPGSRVISNYFVFPDAKPSEAAGRIRVYTV